MRHSGFSVLGDDKISSVCQHDRLLFPKIQHKDNGLVSGKLLDFRFHGGQACPFTGFCPAVAGDDFVPPILYLLDVIFFAPPKHRKSFCALVGAFHSASPPKRTKGNHLTLESESSPWAFHPCRVLRQLRREVSLSYLNPRRLVGGNPTLEAAFLAQHLCFSPCGLLRFVPLMGQAVTAYCPPGSGPEECIR